MQILNWIPSHAQQIRYVAPYYEEDNDGDRHCVNEDEATEVWHDIIREVHKTKRPMYYRRRTIDLARRDRHSWQRSVFSHNNWQKNWDKDCNYVRVKVIGKRVVFIYDEEFMHKNWITSQNKIKLQEKIRKLRENKFKDYGKKILKRDEIPTKANEFMNWLDEEIPELTHEIVVDSMTRIADDEEHDRQ